VFVRCCVGSGGDDGFGLRGRRVWRGSRRGTAAVVGRHPVAGRVRNRLSGSRAEGEPLLRTPCVSACAARAQRECARADADVAPADDVQFRPARIPVSAAEGAAQDKTGSKGGAGASATLMTVFVVTIQGVSRVSLEHVSSSKPYSEVRAMQRRDLRPVDSKDEDRKATAATAVLRSIGAQLVSNDAFKLAMQPLVEVRVAVAVGVAAASVTAAAVASLHASQHRGNACRHGVRCHAGHHCAYFTALAESQQAGVPLGLVVRWKPAQVPATVGAGCDVVPTAARH
jgi:hypothetical protein